MSMGAGVYRDGEVAARLRLQDLLVRRRGELAELSPAAGRVVARRIGRFAGGIAGTLPVAAMAVVAIENARGGNLWLFLLSAGPLALVGYGLGRLIGQRLVARTLEALLATGADLQADVARLEEEGPRALVNRLARRWERASIGMPLTAFALSAPLTIHYLFSLLVDDASGFESWICISMVIVGHSHLVLAACAWRFATQVGQSDRLDVTTVRAATRESWGAYGWTLLSSFFPGLLALAVPPALVAATGLAVIPTSFGWMKRRIAREREILECMGAAPHPTGCEV